MYVNLFFKKIHAISSYNYCAYLFISCTVHVVHINLLMVTSTEYRVHVCHIVIIIIYE